MADANKRKRDDAGAIEMAKLLKNYAEVVFYESMFSAQFTANIQILFRIDDIVLKLPADTFAARFPETKQDALNLISTAVNEWKRTLDPILMAFFDANDMSKAVSIVAQKGVLNVSLPDKQLKLPVKDNSITCIMAAIELLRYPLARMESIQRGRSGTLLDLEKDAAMIMAMHDECDSEAEKLIQRLDLIAVGKSTTKKQTVSKKVSKKNEQGDENK